MVNICHLSYLTVPVTKISTYFNHFLFFKNMCLVDNLITEMTVNKLPSIDLSSRLFYHCNDRVYNNIVYI